MTNKFAEQRKKRSSYNMTEELANKLYEDESANDINNKDEVAETEEAVTSVKRGRGRPKKDDEKYTIVNFRIKESLKENIRLAASAHSLSMGAFITKLIEDDINENLATYQQFQDIRKKLGV